MPAAFSRKLTAEAMAADPTLLDETRAQVRAHLSMVATRDDDPDALVDEVTVWEQDLDDDAVLVIGSIDRDPNAVYLLDEFDPDEEAVANPLSVPSDHGEPSIAEGGQP